MPEIGGVDFAWSKPDPNALRNAGYSFVVGYLSTDPSKNLSAAQVAAYAAAGLQVGLVWETTADRALSGTAGGAVDGAQAEQQANAVGYPRNCVVFFAVDFDASPAQMSAVADYGAAFNAATSRPAGVYGSFRVVEALVTPGQQPISYGWQTAAWSGGQLSGKAHLYQRASHVNWPVPPGVDPSSFDEDVMCMPLPLMGAGVLLPPSPSPLPPPPPPPPAPASGFDVRAWRVSFGQSDEHLPALRRWANRMYPGYRCTPLDAGPTTSYGPQTRAFVAEFGSHVGVPNDGRDIGPRIAAALAAEGFGG